MNEAFHNIITADSRERRDLFLTAAARLGTAVENVEKDFWVCWVLDILFNGRDAEGPRLLFKGGTSLSKAFGLISRFSEDIDVTVFRDDLGQTVDVADLDGLSGKQRRNRLDAIRNACQVYINGPLFQQIEQKAASIIPDHSFRLEPDPDDDDHQSLLFWYPTTQTREHGYIRYAVKIESGAKSALDPHLMASVTPYIAEELPDLDLKVSNVVTVHPERTFWDKIMILHGLRQWYDRRGVLRHGGQRVSRHYYDVHQILRDERAMQWLKDTALAEDCARHARLFFGSKDLGLEAAKPGTYTLTVPPAMRDALTRDYEAMAGMVFHGVPPLDEVIASIEMIERMINGVGE